MIKVIFFPEKSTSADAGMASATTAANRAVTAVKDLNTRLIMVSSQFT